VVVRIESRSAYDEGTMETMWLTKRDRNRAMEDAMKEVLYVGGLLRWKTLEWIDHLEAETRLHL